MMRAIFALSIGAVGTVALAGAFAACALDSGGTAGGGADATTDVGADHALVDAPLGDGGGDALDAGADVDAGDADGGLDCNALLLFSCGSTCASSCASCDAGIVECLGSRVCATDCSACGDGVIPCYVCAGGPPLGFCRSVKCAPGNECACAGGDAGECPGATQICTGGGTPKCLTCGSAGTDHKQCANGLSCKESTGTCQ